jgi:hypothetical protein
MSTHIPTKPQPKHFTATEVEAAIHSLLECGSSPEAICGGQLVGALRLASAARVTAQRGAELSSEAMRRFDIGGEVSL